MKKIIKILFVFALFTACENQDWNYPDFDYTTVYFPYQSPVRTIVLGEDYIYDNTSDNQHKCTIMATMGGVYENKKEVLIEVALDTSLCTDLKFGSATGDNVIAMPSNYYSLPEKMQIVIPSGKLMGGIEVQLTDAFFDDINSIKNTYVIPLVIQTVTNADSVLRGETTLDTADRRIDGEWTILPKDYILYAIKYINPWHANYLRRGMDVVKGKNGNTALDNTIIYHEKYVEYDEVCNTVTRSRYEVSISLNAINKDESKTSFQLMLTFDENGKCSIKNPDAASYSLSGTGEYVKEGDMWGGENRDVLHLQYTIDFETTTHSFTDTLVLRDRGVEFETFNPVVIN